MTKKFKTAKYSTEGLIENQYESGSEVKLRIRLRRETKKDVHLLFTFTLREVDNQEISW
jgi:hypothetical protein